MGRAWLGIALSIAVSVGPRPPAAAASFVLGEAERREAIRVGQRSIVSEEFGAEWTLRDGAGQSLTVMTPFHRLALAARNAAFRREALRPRDVEAVVREASGRLALWVRLHGPRPDFARFFLPVLRAGEGEVKPSFVQNERTARAEPDGRYLARCFYVFPAEGLAGEARVTLLIRDFEEREVATFTIDLAAMR